MSGQPQTLYRKWRSQTFADLVGQDAISQTLRHAVVNQRLSHAYLFCGPRGTGKTSSARLLAKMVNCQNLTNGEPCNTCTSCVEITEGRSTDVYEIDAASNRGVDDIRDLRDRVRVMSAVSNVKVYIIDECHMLTNEAFNALLKTLEEPPPRTIFVLATTDPQKLLPTVVSRCQRFDFRRISIRDIVGRLSYIASQEEMMVEPAAFDILARAAQGGMRDALSLLDQARAFCGMSISAEAVRGMLGMTDPTMVRELVTFVATNDTAAGLHRINELVQSGMDLRQLASQMADLWRQLLLVKAGADVGAILDLSRDEIDQLTELARPFVLEHLTECARIFARNDTGARAQTVPQLLLELSFLDCVAAVHRPAQLATVPATAPVVPAPAAPVPAPRASAQTATPAPAPTPQSKPFAPSAVVQPTPAPTQPVSPAVAPETSTAPRPSSPVGDQSDLLGKVLAEWDLIKKVCKQASVPAASLLNQATPIAVEPGTPPTILFVMEFDSLIAQLEKPEKRKVYERSILDVLGFPCLIRGVLKKDADHYQQTPAHTPVPPPPVAGPAPADPSGRQQPTGSDPVASEPVPPNPAEDPLVAMLVKTYNGTVKGVIHETP